MGAAKGSAKIDLSSCIHLPQLLASGLMFSIKISLVKLVQQSLILLHYRHKQTEQQYHGQNDTFMHLGSSALIQVLRS